jgi:hypothetical protein
MCCNYRAELSENQTQNLILRVAELQYKCPPTHRGFFAEVKELSQRNGIMKTGIWANGQIQRMLGDLDP